MRVERPGRPRRLREYDYSQDGAYSVTVCTDWRTHLFGRVTDGRMELNAAGQAVEAVWYGLPEHYAHVELDVFVVMPDHVHGIVVFCGWGFGSGFGFRPDVGECDRWVSTGRGRLQTGPYARGRATGKGRFETGPYAGCPYAR